MSENDTDLTLSLRELGDDIIANKIAKGWKVSTPETWEDEEHISSVLCLIHSEVSEAPEALRKDDKDGFSEELADVMIRLVGLTHGLQIDLGAEVMKKLAKNQTRAHKHGGKRL